MKRLNSLFFTFSVLNILSTFAAHADQVNKIDIRKIDCLNILESAFKTQGRQVAKYTHLCYMGYFTSNNAGEEPIFYILYNTSEVDHHPSRDGLGGILFGTGFTGHLSTFDPVRHFPSLDLKDEELRGNYFMNGWQYPTSFGLIHHNPANLQDFRFDRTT